MPRSNLVSLLWNYSSYESPERTSSCPGRNQTRQNYNHRSWKLASGVKRHEPEGSCKRMNRRRHKVKHRNHQNAKYFHFSLPYFSHFAKENLIREIHLIFSMPVTPPRDGMMIAKVLNWEPPSVIIRKHQLSRTLPCWCGSIPTHLGPSSATEVSLYHCWGYRSIHTLEALLHCLLLCLYVHQLAPLSELWLYVLQNWVVPMSHYIIIPSSSMWTSRIQHTAHFLPLISYFMEWLSKTKL